MPEQLGGLDSWRRGAGGWLACGLPRSALAAAAVALAWPAALHACCGRAAATLLVGCRSRRQQLLSPVAAHPPPVPPAPLAPSPARNPRAASWFLEDLPVHKAAFTAGGAHVVLTGRRPFFYLLDVQSQSVERLASLRAWRDERSFESFVTSQASPQPGESCRRCKLPPLLLRAAAAAVTRASRCRRLLPLPLPPLPAAEPQLLAVVARCWLLLPAAAGCCCPQLLAAAASTLPPLLAAIAAAASY